MSDVICRPRGPTLATRPPHSWPDVRKRGKEDKHRTYAIEPDPFV